MTNPLSSATNTLLTHYDRAAAADTGFFSDASRITTSDLEALIADGSTPQDLREAAQFILDSAVSQRYLDTANGSGGFDGRISRDDLQSAAQELAGPGAYNALLDTAAGQRSSAWNPFSAARDGNVGDADIAAALADPGVPQEVKDALQLLQQSGDTTRASELLRSLTPEGAAAASALQNTPAYAALSDADRALVAQAFVDSGASTSVARDLATLVGDPSFQAMTPAQRTAALSEAALLQTPEFKALSPADQRLVTEALANRTPGDTGLPAALKTLIESAEFQSSDQFGADERTALLSQVRNYPDSRSVENLGQLIGKDWFRDFDLGDSQRALKAVAYLSQNDAGDMTIIDNTLDLFLADDAPYRFDFGETSAYGSVPPEPGDLFQMNRAYIGADNNPVDMSANSTRSGELRVIGHTFVHEVNHMRNWDKSLSLNSSYGFHEEYRAFYVGSQAQHGRTPTVADVIDRVAGFVNVDGSYDHLAALLDAKGADAQGIVDHLNTILGRSDLTVDNARAEVNALVQAKKAAETNGTPLPPELSQSAGVTTGPDGTNNLTNA